MNKTTYLYLGDTLKVSRKLQIPTTNEVKTKVQHLIMIKRGNGKYVVPLYDDNMCIRFKNMKNTGKLVILYWDSQTQKFTELLKDNGVLNQLADYLRDREKIHKEYLKISWWSKAYFDCTDLVYFLKNWKEKDRLKLIEFNWTYNEWDVILIYNENDFDGTNHLAIYIWEWLFISKYWWNDIVMTSLEEMEKYYETNQVRLVKNITKQKEG